MIVPVMAISNLVLTQQIYSEETNGAHAHYREPVPLTMLCLSGFELYSRWVPLFLRRGRGYVDLIFNSLTFHLAD